MAMRGHVIIYARFRRDWLSVGFTGTDHCWEDRPEAAISRTTGNVLAIGASASEMRAPEAVRLSGFDSDHTILHDYAVARLILKYAIRHIYRARWGLLSPLVSRIVPRVLVLHPLAPVFPLNGFERHGLERLGQDCLASRTYIWEGPELTKADFAESVHTT